jgi:hypothetical protein
MRGWRTRSPRLESRFDARFTHEVDGELMVAASLENPFLANNARQASEADLRALLAAAGAGAG